MEYHSEATELILNDRFAPRGRVSEPQRSSLYALAETMTSPVKFRNVHYYRIAGKYIFAGDLYVTRGALYFFPEVDLDEQRHQMSSYLPHDLAFLAMIVIAVLQSVGGSYASRVEFWQEGMRDEEFQVKALKYIEELKKVKASGLFPKALPIPTRVTKDEISNLQMSFNGNLSFSAQSDTHDFKVGLARKKSLRNALWEAGFR